MRATSDAVALRAARAARAEGQVRAGAGLGGARGDRRASRAAARPRSASRRSWAAPRSWPRSTALYERVEREGTAHLVTLVGEAGVGKSRLLREFESRLAARPRRARRSAPAAACPTAAASSSGRSARCCAPECGIVDSRLQPTRPGASCSTTPASCSEATDERERARRPSARPRCSAGCSASRCRPSSCPPGEDPERLRESFFSALRSGIEAMGEPAARWCSRSRTSTGPTTACSTRSSTSPSGCARRCCSSAWRATSCSTGARPGAAGARSATQALLEPLTAGDTESLVAALLPRPARPCCRRSWSAPAATRCSPRRWCAGSPRRAARRRPSCPTPSRPCWRPASTRSSPFERRLVQQAAVVGRTFWEGSLAPLAGSEGRDLARGAASRSRRRTSSPPAPRAALAGERELAFKHVLIRDVAYGMLPKAVRCAQALRGGRLHRGARRRPHRRGRGAARRALRPRRGARPRGRAAEATSSSRSSERAVRFLEEAGDAAALLYANREAASHYRHARQLLGPRGRPADGVRDRREAGRRVAAPRPRGRGDRGLARVPRLAPRARRTSSAWPTCTASSARRCRTRASARPRSSTTRRASTCSRTARRGWSWCASTRRPPGCTCTPATTCSPSTPPRRRCAWPSGSARRAPPAARTASSGACSGASATPRRRARTSSARWSWRARCATGGSAAPTRASQRRDDPGAVGARPPPRGLRGRHARRPRGLRGGARAGRADGRPAGQVELHASLAQLAAYGADWEQVRALHRGQRRAGRARGPGGQAVPALSRCAGCCAGARGTSTRPPCCFHRAHELAEQVGWSELAFQALFGLATALRDSRRPGRRAAPRSTGRSTSASAPA